VKLEPGGSAREPDILFIAKENLGRLTEERLIGPADLIVEVISRGSLAQDRDSKFKEYCAARVREYWIVDPRPGKQRADFFHLDEVSTYKLFATEEDEKVESKILPGFWLRPAWLWQVETISPFMAFFEMRGVSTEQAQQIQKILRGEATESNEGSSN
jgi:Uma2 family endonuclease